METIKLLLLVEDDDNDVLLTQRKIQRAELPVGQMVVARTLAEALRLLRAEDFDLVLLDLNLGSESRGLDTLRAVRPEYDGVLIVLTSIGDEQTGVDAVRMGAEDYLVKGTLTEERLRSSVAFARVRHDIKHTTTRIGRSLDRLDAMTGG